MTMKFSQVDSMLSSNIRYTFITMATKSEGHMT